MAEVHDRSIGDCMRGAGKERTRGHENMAVHALASGEWACIVCEKRP